MKSKPDAHLGSNENRELIGCSTVRCNHDDVMTWKRFQHYWTLDRVNPPATCGVPHYRPVMLGFDVFGVIVIQLLNKLLFWFAIWQFVLGIRYWHLNNYVVAPVRISSAIWVNVWYQTTTNRNKVRTVHAILVKCDALDQSVWVNMNRFIEIQKNIPIRNLAFAFTN